MLIVPKAVQEENHREAVKGVTNKFNDDLEKILNENSHQDLYWILGKANIQKKHGKKIVRPFLQACAEKPGLIKNSFVYEVDNRKGMKTLLWVLYPDGSLHFPTLGKTIRATNDKG